jgi:hypothetical protein
MMTVKSSLTSGQKKLLVRVASDAMESALEMLDLSSDEAQSFLEQGDAFKRFLLEEVQKRSKMVRYPIIVDYGKSVEEMVAAGQYDWEDGDITSKNFRKSGTGVVAVSTELVCLDKSISRPMSMVAHLKANGFRPATLAELLAFGATYPETQRQFPVVALGSSRYNSEGYRFFPRLDQNVYSRRLVMGTVSTAWWADICRCLAVRE